MAGLPNNEQRRQLLAVNKQSQRRRALCLIVVNGQDVTRAIDPHLLSVTTVERLGFSNEADTAVIELDDRDGRLAIPPPRAKIEIWFGWMNESSNVCWTGEVQQVESGFSRRGGARRLWIEAISFDWYSLKKTHFRKAWGEGEGGQDVPLERVLDEAGKVVGLTVKITPSMRNIVRKYWAQNESFLHFGWRLAKELGGDFKVIGDVAVMVNATDDKNADGQPMQTIEANWGENLISWRITPFSAQFQNDAAATVVYNRKTGEWERYEKPVDSGPLPFGLSDSIVSLPAPAATRINAEQWNLGLTERSRAEKGTGSIVINGEPAAKVRGRVTIKGARAGVDGTYAIDVVEHSYSRTSGFITTLSLKKPEFFHGELYGDPWSWVKKPETKTGG